MSTKTTDLPDMQINVFNSGWVRVDKKVVIKGAPSENIRMPATFAMFRHPEHGVILYDTGYSVRFYEATAKMPYRVMRRMTPAEITEEDNADRRLATVGVKPEEVKTIILGHGHVDHVPGVIYFPEAQIIIDKREWRAMQGPAIKIFTKGYIKSLYEGIKNEIRQVDMTADGKPLGPFDFTIDLWGDGSMTLVSLPGHTAGQMGLLVNGADGRRFFFIGDAAWLSENYLDMKNPPFPARVILSSFKLFKRTLRMIHDFHKANPNVMIIPCHCPASWAKLKEMGLGC